MDRFVERVLDYGAAVRTTTHEDVSSVLTDICAQHEAKRLAYPDGLRSAWRPNGVQLVADTPLLDPQQLDGLDGVITGCVVAAAETGTVVLDHGPDQGRRALTLLPDLHLCVVEATQIVPDVPDLFPLIATAVGAGRPLTLISGPSATSDIELDRVEGVHGPRRLEVVIATPDQPPRQDGTYGYRSKQLP